MLNEEERIGLVLSAGRWAAVMHRLHEQGCDTLETACQRGEAVELAALKAGYGHETVTDRRRWEKEHADEPAFTPYERILCLVSAKRDRADSR